MTRLDLIAALRTMRACNESIVWLESLTCDSAEECWTSCRRSDWMYWLLCNVDVDVDVTESVWRELACDSAASVAEIGEAWFREHAPDHAGAITEAIAAGRSGDAARMSAAEAAAEAAAQAAAESASRHAAQSAARSAARLAARYAAWYAAWLAAEAAAQVASRHAAQSAARSAAWLAARSAAWYAAEAAAEAAAQADQASGVSRLIPWSTVEAAMVMT